MALRTLRNASIQKGTRALVRADFDEALKNGRLQDDFRIRASIPTLRYLLKRGGIPRIIAHLDRPGGRRQNKLSLKPIAERLSRLLGRKVVLVRDPTDTSLRKKLSSSPDVLLFENIRFWPGEEKNDASFARLLARWGEIYINEAFAASHRAHASMAALAKIIPPYAGLNLEREISFLAGVLERSRRPVVAIIGGAKTETKLPAIERLLRSGAAVLVAGAPANTFFIAQGRETKKSLADKKFVPRLRRLQNHPRLTLPTDVRWHQEAIVDIGPRSLRLFLKKARDAETIIWNGPLGYTPKFSRGTSKFAKGLKRARGLKIVGGGDTVAILRKHRLLGVFDYVSTGGGAMLEFLAGKKLPGIEALKRIGQKGP